MPYPINWLLFGLISFFVTIALIIKLKPLAVKTGLIDVPDTRKQHSGHIPLIGGVTIFLSIVFTLFLGGLLNPHHLAYLAASIFLVTVGLIDDYKNIGTLPRFGTQIAAALIMINAGHVQIQNLGNLLGYGEIRLQQYSGLFTVFAVVGGINAFNMIDGMDGLAGSLALCVFLVIIFLCDAAAHSNIMLLSLLFVTSLTGFLYFNLRICGRRASVFLGDTGSTLIGFSVCWFLIALSQGANRSIEPVTVLWILALPLMDTVAIMIRRIRQKRSPFAPDREHFHHILPVAGFSHNQTLVIILTVSILLTVFGLSGEYFHIKTAVMFYGFLALFFIYLWAMSHAWQIMKRIKQINHPKKTAKI